MLRPYVFPLVFALTSRNIENFISVNTKPFFGRKGSRRKRVQESARECKRVKYTPRTNLRFVLRIFCLAGNYCTIVIT